MMTRHFLPSGSSLALLAALLAAGCSGGPFGETGSSGAPVAAAPAGPPVNMAGRWRLVSANGGACGMTFTAAAGEGTIAPEGGCPANFFTSRRWVFEQGALVIQDHTRKPLIAMKQNAAGRFEGELANREVVWLER
jgi:Protease inhibitor Inh